MTESSNEKPQQPLSKAESKSTEVPIDLTYARTQLELGEEILWFCRCDAKRWEAHGRLAIYIGIPMLFFIGLLCLATSVPTGNESANLTNWVGPILNILALVGIGVFLFQVPKHNKESFGKAIHVLTNRRIFVSRPGKGPAWAFRLYNLEDLSTTQNSDGTGDISFAYTPRIVNRQRGVFTLFGIPNAKAVEKQIADAIANAKQS